MKTKFNVVLTLLLAFAVQLTFAQQKLISGTISDANGVPLPGVNVLVKGTNNGDLTNINGKYSVSASPNDILVISYVGYKNQEIQVGNATTINVTMKEDVAELDEVVVVAYGTSSLEAFTGSASVVGEKELSLRTATNPLSAIEGNATGVQFTSASGQPGSSPQIVIRGVGTLNGSADPLFIVDGVQFEGSINTINQNDIASFTILKDAASTSLYGSRAANGVVLITTKRGTKGEIKTNLSVQSGFVSRGIPAYDKLNPKQYYEIMWEALKNSSAGDGDPEYASENIYNALAYNPFDVPNDQIVGTDGRINPDADLIYKSLNWYDVLDKVGVRTSYNVNVSGGGEKHKVFFSASYLDEEGYVITSDYNRLTTRLNADFDVAEWLTLGGSANISTSESNNPAYGGANPFSTAQFLGPIYPVYVNDLNGNLVRDAAGNPVFDNGEGYPEYNIGARPEYKSRHALQELLLNKDKEKYNTYGFRFYTDFKLLDGLNFKLTYGSDINDFINKGYDNNIIGDGQPTGRYKESRFRREVKNFNQIITFNKTFGKVHNIDITAGHESFERTYSNIYGYSIQQVVENVYEFDNFTIPTTISGSTTNKRLEGYFLRVNYNYDNKYYISASARRDGSSVFSQKSRWGNFYSVGASWRIDQENFMKNVLFINSLKLRGSYGEVGNDNLGDFFISQPRYGLSSNAGNPALIYTEIGNANLQWETIENFDVALEFTLFNRFLDGSVEYYKRTSTDLLYDLPIALSNGLDEFPTNVADMYNSGFEMSLTSHIFNQPDFSWDLTLQGSTFKNEIISIPDPFISGTKRWANGHSRYDFYLYHTANVDPETGDQLYLKFELDDDGNSVPVLDANGEQEVVNDWQDTERAYTGDTSIPDFIGSISNSINYKGFTLDFLITYGIGGKVLDGAYNDLMQEGDFGEAYHPDILNAWRKPGDITNVPRLENGNSDLVNGSSTRFLTDADFWAIKNINLGYNFDSKITDALNIDNLRLYVSGENLYIKSARKGLNPQDELSGTPSGRGYSPSRIFSVGLNLSF